MTRREGTGTSESTNTLSTSAAGVLSSDTPCVHCGYNLRGLDPAGNCPECGTEIAKSIDSELMRAMRLRLLRKIWWGLIIAGVISAMTAVVLVLNRAFRTIPFGNSSGSVTRFSVVQSIWFAFSLYAWPCAAGIVRTIAGFLLTTSFVDPPRRRTFAWIVRAALIVELLAVVIHTCINLSGPWQNSLSSRAFEFIFYALWLCTPMRGILATLYLILISRRIKPDAPITHVILLSLAVLAHSGFGTVLQTVWVIAGNTNYQRLVSGFTEWIADCYLTLAIGTNLWMTVFVFLLASRTTQIHRRLGV